MFFIFLILYNLFLFFYANSLFCSILFYFFYFPLLTALQPLCYPD